MLPLARPPDEEESTERARCEVAGACTDWACDLAASYPASHPVAERATFVLRRVFWGTRDLHPLMRKTATLERVLQAAVVQAVALEAKREADATALNNTVRVCTHVLLCLSKLAMERRHEVPLMALAPTALAALIALGGSAEVVEHGLAFITNIAHNGDNAAALLPPCLPILSTALVAHAGSPEVLEEVFACVGVLARGVPDSEQRLSVLIPALCASMCAHMKKPALVKEGLYALVNLAQHGAARLRAAGVSAIVVAAVAAHPHDRTVVRYGELVLARTA